ncbi:uncharacterized protein LOC129236875 [Anastrepha obliqua]|uniref:uncharacterized protein LOC129236875 n=1 Tax=Anastrepha obliqua TaxID=95512 RepID=UPI00240978E5|nr:uncharacterized protein LOC129236875 [Anastrepha obliqua]
MATRRVPADESRGNQNTRARTSLYTDGFVEANEQSYESADSARGEHTQRAAERYKNNKSKTRGKYYEDDAGASEGEDFSRVQNKKQASRSHEKGKHCVRTERSCEPGYAKGSNSATETEMGTDAAAITTCSYKSRQRRKFNLERLLDDVVCNSDYVSDPKYNRNAVGGNRYVTVSDDYKPLLLTDSEECKHKRSTARRTRSASPPPTPQTLEKVRPMHTRLPLASATQEYVPKQVVQIGVYAPLPTLLAPATYSTLNSFVPYNRQGPYAAQPARQIILPTIQALGYVEQNNVQDYALPEPPPQVDNVITNDNLVSVTYTAPQPTHLNQENGELKSSQNSNERPMLNTNVLTDSSTRPIGNNRAVDLEEDISIRAHIQNFNYTINSGRANERISNGRDKTDDEDKANGYENTNDKDKNYGEADINWENKPRKVERPSMRTTHGEEERNRHEKTYETKELHSENESNRKKFASRKDDSQPDTLDESQSGGETSRCSIRECKRKKRKRKNNKCSEKHRSLSKKRRHYRKESKRESSQSPNHPRYSEMGKRYKYYEHHTTTGSESDDELDCSFSRTSCKAIKKCCSRRLAICRTARAAAGTQRDQCCDYEQKTPVAKVNQLDNDIQKSIIECLANADQKAVRKIIELNRDKKRCKVCTCGIVGDNGTPVMKNDMIILKFEEDDSLAAQQRLYTRPRSLDKATNCKCEVTDAESEIVRELITKKQLHEKTRRYLAQYTNSSSDCLTNYVCEDEQEVEPEFMQDLLRKQRRERNAQNNSEDYVREHLANVKCLKDTFPATQEPEIVHMDSIETVAKLRNKSYVESESRCACTPKKDLEITQMRLLPIKRNTGISEKSETRSGHYTHTSSERMFSCKPSKEELEAQGATYVNSKRIKDREMRASYEESIVNYTCQPSKNAFGVRRTKPVTSKRATLSPRDSSDDIISSGSRVDKQNEVAERNNSNRNEIEAPQANSAKSKWAMDREVNGSYVEELSRNVRGDKTHEHQKITPKSYLGSAPQQPLFTDFKPRACRANCACIETSRSTSEFCMENVANYIRDYKTKATRIIPKKANTERIPHTTRHTNEGIQRCNTDCVCKEIDESDSDENLVRYASDCDENIMERRTSTGDNTKATKKSTANCTLSTNPESNKNSERKMHNSIPKAKLSSNSSVEQRRAALCAELTLNELLPEHSLRTLLTKLSSPNGKLFYIDDRHSVPAENMRIFALDESKLLNLKEVGNGKVSPTMFMSQSIRMAGKEVDGTPNIGFQPLLVHKKRRLKVWNSAPSLTTSQVQIATGNSKTNFQRPHNTEHLTNINDSALHTITRSTMQVAKEARLPLPDTSHSSGCSDQPKPMSKSESSEVRSNTRPIISQVSDSNHRITRLWPEQSAVQQTNREKELAENKSTYGDTDRRQLKKAKHVRQQLAMETNVKSQSHVEFGIANNDKFGHKTARSPPESSTYMAFKDDASVANTGHKKKRSSLPIQNAPLDKVNILAPANRRRRAKESSASNESDASQQQSKQRNSLRRVKTRKTSTEKRLKTPSEHSIKYVKRLHSPTTSLSEIFNKNKQRVTRSSISDDEQMDSDMDYISVQYESSDSDLQYRVDLERKKELWRKGTVREAIEVEEETERARNLQRTTLTGECLERAIHYPTGVWNEERRQLNLKRNSAGIFGPF